MYLLVLMFAGQLIPASHTILAAPISKTLTIVAFGDSTTAVRSTVKRVYADRLPQLLRAHGVEAQVINAGVGGSHTGRLEDNARHKRQHAMDRFDTAVRSHKPDIVIIQFGWNDSWVDSADSKARSRIAVDQYSRNLKFMIDTLRSDGARVILMTPNRPRSTVEKWRVARTVQYVQAVRDLSKTSETPLVDIWAEYERRDKAAPGSADRLLLDNVHPSSDGHKLVAEMLARRILGMQTDSAHGSR